MRVLFVSNGHGEAAIADRIAAELKQLRPQAALDHLGLVGVAQSAAMRDVGPRRRLPSGGLIAMGNAGNLLRDLRAGLLGLLAAQRRFLRGARGGYDAAVAVGDAYALAMTLCVRAPTVFVGTAKSVRVAPYGRFERRLLARAARCFVRDEATARRLHAAGLRVEPAANVIVDLFAPYEDAAANAATHGFEPALALLPGSRANAYADAAFLLALLRELAPAHPRIGAVLSIAPGLDAQRFARAARGDGWELVAEPGFAFSLAAQGRTVVRAWSGALNPIFGRVALVLGQAGTANEGAAAAGLPVVAFQGEREGAARWYRRRQCGLLGEALAVYPRRVAEAAAAVAALLDDPARRGAMGEAGRRAMGEAGGARRIAGAIVSLAQERACVA